MVNFLQEAHSLLQSHSYKIQKHCYKTLLQLQNIDKTSTCPTTQLIEDCGTQITTDKFKELIGEMEKVNFGSGYKHYEVCVIGTVCLCYNVPCYNADSAVNHGYRNVGCQGVKLLRHFCYERVGEGQIVRKKRVTYHLNGA